MLSRYMVLSRLQLSFSPQQQRQQQRDLITGLLQTGIAPLSKTHLGSCCP